MSNQQAKRFEFPDGTPDSALLSSYSLYPAVSVSLSGLLPGERDVPPRR